MALGLSNKFRVGPNPLENENKIKKMVPTKSYMNEHLMVFYRNKLNEYGLQYQQGRNENEKIQAEANAYATATRLEQIRDSVVNNRLEDQYVDMFNCWLLGTSPYNVDIKKKDALSEKEKKLIERTPWGKSPLRGPSIDQYINQYIDKKFAFENQLTKLKLFPPRDIATAWLYFKYIVCPQNWLPDEFHADFNWWTDLTNEYKKKSGLKPDEEAQKTRTSPLTGGDPGPVCEPGKEFGMEMTEIDSKREFDAALNIAGKEDSRVAKKDYLGTTENEATEISSLKREEVSGVTRKVVKDEQKQIQEDVIMKEDYIVDKNEEAESKPSFTANEAKAANEMKQLREENEKLRKESIEANNQLKNIQVKNQELNELLKNGKNSAIQQLIDFNNETIKRYTTHRGEMEKLYNEVQNIFNPNKNYSDSIKNGFVRAMETRFRNLSTDLYNSKINLNHYKNQPGENKNVTTEYERLNKEMVETFSKLVSSDSKTIESAVNHYENMFTKNYFQHINEVSQITGDKSLLEKIKNAKTNIRSDQPFKPSTFLENHENELRKLQRQMDQHLITQQANEKMIDILKRREGQTAEAYERRTKEYQEKTRLADILQKRITEMDQKNQATIEELERQRTRYGNKILDLEAQISTARKESESEKTQLETQIRELNKKLDTLKLKEDALAQRTKEFAETREELKKERKQTEIYKKGYEENNKIVENLVHKEERTKKEYEEKLKTKEEDISSLKKRLEKRNREINEVEREKIDEEDMLKRMGETLQKRNEDLKKTEQSLKEAREREETLKKQKEDLEEILRSQFQANSKATEHPDEIDEELDRIRNPLPHAHNAPQPSTQKVDINNNNNRNGPGIINIPFYRNPGNDPFAFRNWESEKADQTNFKGYKNVLYDYIDEVLSVEKQMRSQYHEMRYTYAYAEVLANEFVKLSNEEKQDETNEVVVLYNFSKSQSNYNKMKYMETRQKYNELIGEGKSHVEQLLNKGSLFSALAIENLDIMNTEIKNRENSFEQYKMYADKLKKIDQSVLNSPIIQELIQNNLTLREELYMAEGVTNRQDRVAEEIEKYKDLLLNAPAITFSDKLELINFFNIVQRETIKSMKKKGHIN